MAVRIIVGNSAEKLKTLDAESVHCVVTSPPYWGLRDYGVAGQLGLEKTPEEHVDAMVAVFREVRRVLRSDGTLWLNYGDSYAASGPPGGKSEKQDSNRGSFGTVQRNAPVGLKPKDLVGMPWRVARALQEPYYTGKIRDALDRVWLAAAIDGEGCIYIHKRKAGQNNGQGYERKHASYGSGLEVSNTCKAFVDRCLEIAGQGSVCHQDDGRRQRLWRWTLRSNQCRDVLSEVYPYLVAKQHEARLAIGCPSKGPDAATAHESLKAIHNGGDSTIDFSEPQPMFRPGFYLRSDIIWSKNNPMPESVTDRPTKSHEYVFLMTKNARYFYDAEAVREEAEYGRGTDPTGKMWDRQGINAEHKAGSKGHTFVGGRNLRDVWTIPTAPFPGAHFATFPPKLVEPCIKAGCPEGGTVLDPFGGAGTVGLVADKLGRDALLIELNPEYAEMARRRIHDDCPFFARVQLDTGDE